MRIKHLSLLIAIAINLLGAQQANAEQHINANNQLAPVWANEQVPIAWADCIPVPVMPLPQTMMNNPMGAMGSLPFDSGFMPPAPYIDPNTGLPTVAPNQPMIPLPPPSPFFNPAEIAPTPQLTTKQLACNNEDTIKLNKLQSHYNRAAAASKAKIAELEQTLDDIQNQMADSRGIINQLESKLDSQPASQKVDTIDQSKFKVLQSAYQLQTNTNNELKKKLNELENAKQDLAKKLALFNKKESAFKELQTAHQHQNIVIYELKKSLEKTKEDAGMQSEKLGILSQTTTKFKVLQQAYQQCTNEISQLEKSLDNSNATLKSQTQKLAELQQTAAKFKVLQQAYQKSSNEITTLKNKLIESERQIAKLKDNSSNQALKLSALGQTTTEFKVLQGAYQLQNHEVVELKKKIVELDTEKKALQLKLEGLKKDRNDLNDQLASLQKTDSEFKVLKGAYELRNNDISKLEKSLAESESSKQTLLAKLSDLEKNLSSQTQKLSALEEESNKLKILQESYKLRTNEIAEFENILAESEASKQALQAKLKDLEKKFGSQTEKLTALEEESKKFKILQDAYKLRTSEITEFKNIIAKSESTQKALQSKLKSLEDNSGIQAQKLTALGQTATEFKVLQGAYQLQNHEVNQLKKKIVELDTEKKALKLKLEGLKKDRSNLNDQLATLQEIDSKYKVLQGAYAKNTKENTELKKKLISIEDKNKSLKTQLSTLESDAATKAEKIAALGEATTELSDLQKAYKDRLSEISELKNKLATLDNEYKSLQAKLTTVESNSANQARKLTALSKSATKLKILQGVYKERNDENTLLKKKLADMETTYKELQAKLGTLEADAASKSQKLQVLGEAASKLSALQIAFKTNFDEKTLLEKQLAEMQNSNNSLQSKLSELESTAANQAEKMAALGKSTTELEELQKAYKAKLQEIADLKTKLAGMDDSYKALQSKLQDVESNASEQEKKLASLAKSADELTALKNAYKTRNDENAELKRKLAEQIKSCNENTKTCKLEISKLQESLAAGADKNKSLLAKLSTFEKTSSDQARQINSLMATANKLKPLKSAYEDLTAKLAAATADGDNDGVLDQKDKCPNSPAGTEVDLSGCLADSDKDGVANSKDQCPTSPEGSAVNSVGCPPIKDADGDGIADKSDLCPNSKVGEAVNTFGCTPSANINLKGVNFATGSATLTASSLPILNRAARTLVNNPTIKVEIAGHTDSQGLAIINKRLSQRRANTVMNYLIKKGASAKRLSAKGYGETQPIASNKTAEGRATNRRVEMKIK